MFYGWGGRDTPRAHNHGDIMHGNLCDYRTAETIRPATAEERAESLEAARYDGGAGVIEIDGRSCYVED